MKSKMSKDKPVLSVNREIWLSYSRNDILPDEKVSELKSRILSRHEITEEALTQPIKREIHGLVNNIIRNENRKRVSRDFENIVMNEINSFVEEKGIDVASLSNLEQKPLHDMSFKKVKQIHNVLSRLKMVKVGRGVTNPLFSVELAAHLETFLESNELMNVYLVKNNYGKLSKKNLAHFKGGVKGAKRKAA